MMTTMQVQRTGRARSPVRPGEMIKQVLTGQITLKTYDGEIYTREAAIVDLHNTYKELIRQENLLREKKKNLKSMTYDSFCHLFKFARYLRLVEFVREEKMIYPPPTGHLYQIAKHNGVHMHVSMRRIFRITPIGEEDERSWQDLTTAYKKNWVIPQKVEYYEPYPELVEKEAAAAKVVKEYTVKEGEEIPGRPPVMVWKKTPSAQLYEQLLGRFNELKAVDIDSTDVQKELYGLSIVVGDWEVYIIEKRLITEKKMDVAKTHMYRVEEDLLHRLFIALNRADIDDAISINIRLIQMREAKGE